MRDALSPSALGWPARPRGLATIPAEGVSPTMARERVHLGGDVDVSRGARRLPSQALDVRFTIVVARSHRSR